MEKNWVQKMKCFILYSKYFSRYSKINYCDRLFDEKQVKINFLSQSPENKFEKHYNKRYSEVQDKKRHNSERRRKRWLSLGLINLIRSPIRNDITPKGDGNL